jgi:hypothetical protein
MGLRDLFKKEKPEGPDPISGLKLSKLKVGYMVDYDLKTWEVTAHSKYDWGDGDITDEWQLRSGDDVVYLEREFDDEDDWSLNRKIPFGSLAPGIRDHLREHDDPPQEIHFEGTTYHLEDMAGGHFLSGGSGPGRPLLRWGYEDDSGEKYLGIEQWGEDEFEATVGVPVEEYQFTNILPGGGGQ